MTDYSEIINRISGNSAEISKFRPIFGGDINKAYLITLSDGSRFFLKENTKKNVDFFRAEMEGISTIHKTGAIRVPKILETGVLEDRSYLVMEYLEASAEKRDYWEHFGRQLAAMHRADPSEWTPGGNYGFPADNYIGASLQVNDIHTAWIDFFRNCRLEIQFKNAWSYFDSSERKAVQHLLDHLDRYLTEPEQPSVLHGDLWSGNFVTGPEGYACLIDPAVYVGHSETDLAMTELFGGFAPAFYDAYNEINRIPSDYSDRRDLYNLYHLLNHLNLFGGSYYGPVMKIIRRFS